MKGGREWWWVLALALMVGLGSCGRESGEGNSEQEGKDQDGDAQTYLLAREDHQLPPGTVMVTTNSFRLTDAILTVEVEGSKRVGSLSSSSETEMRVEVVSDTVMRVAILKDVRQTEKALGGAPQSDPPVDGVLLGHEITFTLRAGSWIGVLEGGEATEEQVAAIEELASKLGDKESIEMFGTQERRVGDEWEIDPRNASFLASEGEFKGRYQIRFDRVEEFQGHRCAVLEGIIDVSRLGETPAAGEGPRMKINARATIYRSLDQFENLKSEIVGNMVMAESSPLGGSRLVRGPLKISKTAALTSP